MERSQFSEASPGSLVPVKINERRAHPASGRVDLTPVQCSAFVPNALPPALDWGDLKRDLFDDYNAVMLALGRLNGLHKSLDGAAPLLRTLWMREAKLSSAVENIKTTLEMMVMAGAGREPGRFSDDIRSAHVRHDAQAAWNYVKALEHGVKSDLPLSVRLVKEMHSILLSELPPDPECPDPRPGEIRDIPLYIGDPERGPRHARFIPPPPGEMLLACLTDFERFANRPSPEVPALVQVALLHYQFETIHPFRDGNGRIGRVLISRALVATGLLEHPVVYFSGYIYRHKREYVDRLLRVSTRGEWAPWVRFLLNAVRDQADDAIDRSEKLFDLRERYRERLKTQGSKLRVLRLVDKLFEVPVVNAEEAETELGVSTMTVYRDLETLENEGILVEVTGRKRQRDWVAREIIQIVEAEDSSAELDRE